MGVGLQRHEGRRDGPVRALRGRGCLRISSMYLNVLFQFCQLDKSCVNGIERS